MTIKMNWIAVGSLMGLVLILFIAGVDSAINGYKARTLSILAEQPAPAPAAPAAPELPRVYPPLQRLSYWDSQVVVGSQIWRQFSELTIVTYGSNEFLVVRTAEGVAVTQIHHNQ